VWKWFWASDDLWQIRPATPGGLRGSSKSRICTMTMSSPLRAICKRHIHTSLPHTNSSANIRNNVSRDKNFLLTPVANPGRAFQAFGTGSASRSSLAAYYTSYSSNHTPVKELVKVLDLHIHVPPHKRSIIPPTTCRLHLAPAVICGRIWSQTVLLVLQISALT
jgi:hypothetical protein